MRRLTVSGILLIVSFVLSVGGAVVLYNRRVYGGFDAFTWERGLVMAGYVAAAIGVLLLGGVLRQARSAVGARVVTTIFVLAAIFALVGEASLLIEGFSMDWGRVIVLFLFAAEAIMGVALFKSGLVPNWVAWTVILWDVLAPAVLLIVSSDDIYYPPLHFIPLLVIGIALVGRARHMPTSKPA
ncbi:MAG TPA: hypothetical protein VGA66_18460 [Mycobacterium sp.]